MARRVACVVIVSAWLAAGCGAEPTADRASAPGPDLAPSTPVPRPEAAPPRELPAPIAAVCADYDCGGAGAAVREWRDESGAVQRLELVDSPRCPHSAGRFFDAAGAPIVVIPRPFFGAGTEEQESTLRDLHSLERRGLTEGARIPCAPP
jgi:hypothetical protein